MNANLIVVPLELDPRGGGVRVPRGEVLQVPDADGAVEGGREENVLGKGTQSNSG